jgi:hypothetical protein
LVKNRLAELFSSGPLFVEMNVELGHKQQLIGFVLRICCYVVSNIRRQVSLTQHQLSTPNERQLLLGVAYAPKFDAQFAPELENVNQFKKVCSWAGFSAL